MRDHRRAPMQFGDGAKIDGKYQLHILAFAQTQIGGLDENTGGTEIDRTAQPAATARQSDVNGGTGAMPGVKSSFQDPMNSECGFLLLYCVA